MLQVRSTRTVIQFVFLIGYTFNLVNISAVKCISFRITFNLDNTCSV